MNNKEIKQTYRRWNFWDRVPLITKDKQWLAYFDNKFGNIDLNFDYDKIKPLIEETIENSIEENVKPAIDDSISDAVEKDVKPTITETIETTINDTLSKVIDEKTNEINHNIDKVEEHLHCDICCAKNDIKKHVDEKIDSLNVEEQFSNLNEQVAEIIKKIDNKS